MRWYDVFSQIYDYSVEMVYRGYRKQIAQALRLQPEDAVLDLACGTGPNHPYLVQQVGPGGSVFGVDLSAGMLARAQRQASRRGWQNVHLLECNAEQLDMAQLCEAGNQDVQLNGVIVTLGLSVIPEWQRVLEHTFALLAPGGRYVVFDIFAQKWVPQTWVVQRLAQADMYRESWKVLDALSEDFSFEFLQGSPHIHGGTPFLASGTKKG
ncbi:MAG: class I SAM-dependent methyltransferase [Myxococcota bacterium]|nr:class I SAM-dependent methyltransferase [Myxococcota bacterium]